MSKSKFISSGRLRVRGACHTRISFDRDPLPGGKLLIEHYRRRWLVGLERRPLDGRTGSLEIKTHPGASHVMCSLQAGGAAIDGVRFNVECGQPIQPTGRNFIVIGAMKAGTTSLFRMLARHPAVCPTSVELPGVSFGKEINYFRKLYRKGHSALHYDWRFPFDPARHAWTLDVSPGYAKWPGSKAVPARIARLGGETKLAYILREPVDRIESHMAHMLAFDKATSMRHCLRTSCYALHLDKFTEHFAREDILLLDFEQLQKDPDAILAQVCDFLSIDRVPGIARVHNRRRVKFRLKPSERAELAQAVRPDVTRLIDHYGFEPAEKWRRKPPVRWLNLPALRK